MLFGKEIPEQRLEPYHDDRDDWKTASLSDEDLEVLQRECEWNVSDETLADIYRRLDL